mgnify:CR=1 FL=1
MTSPSHPRWLDPEERSAWIRLAALTELFKEVKNKNTHVIVERIVQEAEEIINQRLKRIAN